MRSLFFTTCLLFPAITWAQEGRQVECRFLCFGGDGTLTSAIAQSGSGFQMNCPLSAIRISPRFVCFVTSNTIKFLNPTDKKPFASVTIPASVNSALLVFVQVPPRDGAAATWHVMTIEDSKKNFPDGGAFVANFYNKDIRFTIGEHNGLLPAARSHGYEMPKERDAFNMASVVFEFQQGEKWVNANESALRFLPGMRYLIFAYMDPRSGRPKINTIQDIEMPRPQNVPRLVDPGARVFQDVTSPNIDVESIETLIRGST